MADDSTLSEHGPSSGDSRNSGAMVAVPSQNNQVVVPAWNYGPPAVPEILSAAPTPVDLLHSLRRRWLIATGIGLIVGVLLAALVWVSMPIKYETAALLRVSSNKQVILGDLTSEKTADFSTYKRTQAALLKSNFVLSAMLRKPEIQRLASVQKHKDDTIEWLMNQLSVDYPGDAEIMRISMRDDQPKDLAAIVNAVKDSYMDEIVNAEREERLRQRDILERTYQKNRDEIKKRMDAIHLLEKQLNSESSQAAKLSRDMAFKEFNSLAFQRSTLQAQIGDLDLKLLLLKSRAEKKEQLKLPDYIVDEALANDPQIAQHKQNLARYSEALEEESRRAKSPNTPSLSRLQQSIQRLEEAIDERRAELRPALMERLAMSMSTGGGNVDYLPMMETERELLSAKLEKVSEVYQSKLDELMKLDQYSADLETRTAELKELQEVTAKMGSELKLWAIELESRPRITSVESATPPSSSTASRRYISSVFSGVLGFAGVLFCVAFLEFQSRRLNSVHNVRQGLGIRVIGNLPELSSRAWRKLGDSESAHGAALQSLLMETVDNIRATLLHSNGKEPPQVVMVASADVQEGKTTVASQLAASLARSGRRTLLIDADLRNPSSHLVFGAPLNPGFCEVMRGDTDREAAVFATEVPNLWLLPAGQFDAATVQAISGEALAQFFSGIKEHYSFIVLDSPPVLKVADSLMIGQYIDAALISVRRDVSQLSHVHEACERLRSVGIKVLGAIVNGVCDRPVRRSIPAHV